MQIKIKIRLILHIALGISVLAATFANNADISDLKKVEAEEIFIESSSEFSENTEIENENKEQEKENVVKKPVVKTKKITTDTTEYIKQYFSDIPVMADIAYCESRFTQFNKDGTVLRGRVNSKDVGALQINEKYHLKTAQNLGINIYSLDGNLQYGRYLYNTQGVAPWVYSSHCWNNNQVAVK